MKKKFYISGVGLLLLCLTITSSVSIVTQKDQLFSEFENRMLTQKPEFNFKDFIKKDFQIKQETYLKDQFANRNEWMKLKTNIELLFNMRKINDVYIGDNKMLAQEFKLSSQDPSRKETIKAINELARKYRDIKTNVLLIPNKIGLYEDSFDIYPGIRQEDYYQQVMNQLSSNIRKIDTWQILEKHQDEDIFFKTDHHWSGLGAKYVAEKFLNKSLNDYQPHLGNDSFYGSLAKKIAYQKVSDNFMIYEKKDFEKDAYVVEYPNVKDAEVSIYDLDKLQSNDPYSTYFGGNYPVVKIVSANKQKKNLLIFKDSFANIFVPYLLPYYHKIIMVDPRYYYDNIDMLIKDENINEILYLMNMNTFFSDSSLYQMLQ